MIARNEEKEIDETGTEIETEIEIETGTGATGTTNEIEIEIEKGDDTTSARIEGTIGETIEETIGETIGETIEEKQESLTLQTRLQLTQVRITLPTQQAGQAQGRRCLLQVPLPSMQQALTRALLRAE
jgi:hypothetical protein